MVDNPPTGTTPETWISRLTHYVDLAYASVNSKKSSETPDLQTYIAENFPAPARSALLLLPTHLLSFGPLYGLLEGFKTDLEFQERPKGGSQKFPISSALKLERYAEQVAGTVAELILELVFFHNGWGNKFDDINRRRRLLIRAGGEMGVALQYVNIARDIATDAAIGRVYLPTSWLKEEDLTPQDVLDDPNNPKIEILRTLLLGKAFEVYDEAQVVMAQLPASARAPMRVAVESYMEIGRVLREKGYRVKEGKATVPKLRRMKVAWKALSES